MPIFLRESKLFPVKAGGLQSRISENRNVRVFYKNSCGTNINPLCPSTLLFPLLYGSTNHDQSDMKTCRILLKRGLSDPCCSCLTFVKWGKDWLVVFLVLSIKLMHSLVVMYSLVRLRTDGVDLMLSLQCCHFCMCITSLSLSFETHSSMNNSETLIWSTGSLNQCFFRLTYHQQTLGTCGYSVTNHSQTRWYKIVINTFI